VLEQRWRELGAFIRDQRRLGQLSLRKLADRAGVSNPYLSQIERGLRRPSAEILQQIAHALEISSETLYVRAGILDERDTDDDVVALISRDRTLTDDQRQTLTHLYRSFQLANAARAKPPSSDAPSVEYDETDPDPGESSGPR
jgi:transcriptional regulator with XRE-family HTH domain